VSQKRSGQTAAQGGKTFADTRDGRFQMIFDFVPNFAGQLP
jgi:hypothetical protein